MIHVIASIHVKDGRQEEFIEIFKANVPSVLQEQGCLAYAPTVDFPTGLPVQETNDRVVTIVEKWETMENLKAHMTAPHMQAYRGKVKDLVETMTLKVLQEA